MKVMHYPPSDVRAKICKLLEKEGKELVHLSYGLENESDTVWFVGVAYICNSDTSNCYEVISYNSTKGELWQDENYTYANALIEMGTIIE